MTIKPTLITKQFSSAILYSADTASSTLLWVQPAGKGSPLTMTGEPILRLMESATQTQLKSPSPTMYTYHRQGNSGATIDFKREHNRAAYHYILCEKEGHLRFRERRLCPTQQPI